MTPRKTRQQRSSNPQPSQLGQIHASDYESEAPYQPPAPRTNTELNLSVLKRYNPSIHSILSIAASATLYTFSPDSSSWEKSGIEGTLFVCQLLSSPITVADQFCIAILNRRGLDNLELDIQEIEDVEITDEFLILRVFVKANGGESVERVLGVYIHPDKQDTMQVNSLLVRQCWEKTRETMNDVQQLQERLENYGDEGLEGPGQEETIQYQGRGRRLSLRDLFG